MDWTLTTISELLTKQDDWSTVNESDCLIISNEQDIDVYLSICGEQIIAESLLFPVNQVVKTCEFNEEILKTHKFFPLTTVGIVNIDGIEYYAAFGALSAQSKSESILLEIDFLLQNVVGMLEAYENFI